MVTYYAIQENEGQNKYNQRLLSKSNQNHSYTTFQVEINQMYGMRGFY